MKVSPKKAPVRADVEQAGAHAFPAPRRGLVLNENISSDSPETAVVLDNWVCTATGIKARSGSQKYATLPGPVRSLIAYRIGAGALFAATNTAIYDVSSAPNPNGGAAVVSGQTGGDYSATMFGTAGASYLVAVNGADDAQVFDGSAWSALNGASTPAITGVDTSKLSHVWSYANRLFFIEKDTLRAHYLPVDSIGGAVQQVSLAGTFQLGGSLFFGANWSRDAGDGMDDKCVFVSTEGEVAVFSGVNPGDAATWRLAGVYRIGRPLGPSAVAKVGGELLVATEEGLFPLSYAINADQAVLAAGAVSSPIEPLWREYVGLYGASWDVSTWTRDGILLASMASETLDGPMLCCNLSTGAWSRWTGVGACCLAEFGGYVFAGGQDGTVKRLGTGGSDMGQPFTAVYVGSFENLGSPGSHKTALQGHALFKASHDLNPYLGAQTNYRIQVAEKPAAAQLLGVGTWDASLWDSAVWDAPSRSMAMNSFWRGIGRTGYAIAPELQITFSSLAPPDVELVSISMTYRTGRLVA